jgi:hypothetical protein
MDVIAGVALEAVKIEPGRAGDDAREQHAGMTFGTAGMLHRCGD